MRSHENVVLLAVAMDLQGTQEMDEIPRIIRLNDVGK